MLADIIIKNGRCMTMEGSSKQVLDWIAIAGDRITALGDGQDFEALLGENTMVIDAKGCTVLPGFIDSHFHVVQTALNSESLDLSQVKNHRQLGELIKEECKDTQGKQIRGIRLKVEELEERAMPTRTLLDKYCSDRPVWINSYEYQISALNTYAMLYFKIPFTTEGIQVDENLMPTGVFNKKANAALRENILKNISDKIRLDAFESIMEGLIANGITTVNAMEGGFLYSDKDAEFIYEHYKEFPVDIELFYQTMDVDKIKSINLNRLGCGIYIDGTLGSRSAALSFEYMDCPGTMGYLQIPQQELDDFVLKCYENNLQISLYTIGDRAIEEALNAHEHALFQTGNIGLRHRLEHAELINKTQITRCKEMGIILSVQPTYEYYWGGSGKMYEQRLGMRYMETNPLRELIEAGICICGGSDSDVTEAVPLLGIYSAVNHPVKEHRIDLFEAVKMFTYNGAFAIHKENLKGSLGKGKLADIVVLDKDIFNIPIEDLIDVKVSATIKSGELLYTD